MLAKATAAVPKIVVSKLLSLPEATNAPTSVIPDIAFEPDISGVCNVAGTFLISSKPKNTLDQDDYKYRDL